MYIYLIMDNFDSEETFFVDSHNHLQCFSEEERKDIILRCKDKKLKYMIVNSTNEGDFDETIGLSKEGNSDVVIIPGIGHHPW
jgi:Tat protein secretion system quality control protein TatD with DNase activity